MGQLEVVLKHLKEKGTITTMQCIKLYKDTRLSDKIYRLRKLGYNIRGIWRKSPSGKRYKEYYLQEVIHDKSNEM